MGDDDLQRFITGMEPPFFQTGGFFQPEDGPPNNRRQRQHEVWKEFAAPLNSAGPAEVHQVRRSLQEMEERLSDRYDELRQKSERLENRAKVYQLFAQLPLYTTKNRVAFTLAHEKSAKLRKTASNESAGASVSHAVLTLLEERFAAIPFRTVKTGI